MMLTSGGFVGPLTHPPYPEANRQTFGPRAGSVRSTCLKSVGGTLPNVSQTDLRALSIVIPSYNGCVALEQTLACLQREAFDAEVIVVDGGSGDGSRELVLERFPQVRLLDVPNHGYGHNINRGLEVACGQTLVMMNSDVLMPRKTLLAMQFRLEADSRLAAVGPLPLQQNGRKQFSFGFPYWPNWWPIRAPTDIKMLHGYCIATRRDVLEDQGMFDEALFFYNEEYDWCWRVLKAGYRLEILPDTAVHFAGASTPNNAKILLEAQRGGMYVVDKHFPVWIAQATRRFFQLYGWLGGMLHPNPEFRLAFRRLEAMVKRGEYRESPFPLSGRGVVKLGRRLAQKSDL
jgi:GT2 family glycosyltransferase